MTNVDIQEAIQARIKEMAMGADEVLLRLADQARGTMADFVSLRDDGYFIIDLQKAEATDKLHLVKKIQQIRTVKNEEYEEIKTSLELYDRHAALVDLAKHHDLLSSTLRIKVEDELKATLDLLEKTLEPQEYEHILNILAQASTE